MARDVTAPSSPARRRFLQTASAAAGLMLPARTWASFLTQADCIEPPRGELIRTLPLYGPGAQEAPLGTMVGGPGLDARLFTDLSSLDAGRMLTATPDVFVRTAVPPGLPMDAAGWRLSLGGSAAAPGSGPTAAGLAAKASAMGAHLIECAGNSNPRNFGLMSAVEWDGLPLSAVLQSVRPPADAWAVLVSGVDDPTQQSARSQPGASWIFPLDTLDAVGPFLAVAMNGEPLTAHHGAPIRLVVPGWYGCAWIKWVNEIRWVPRDTPATSQMLEFAGRTHQDGRPALARDFLPPEIDTAAMPIRVEQRRVDGALEYRIVGIVWGGRAPVDRLIIRFGPRDAGTPIRVCPPTSRTWSLWTHRWRPSDPGYYDISLKVADAAVRTRRLDLSFYIRRVRIDEV
ncbi:MAG: molybdopterin-dependent oxidoreductase [Vicinamibacterales bacterium]